MIKEYRIKAINFFMLSIEKKYGEISEKDRYIFMTGAITGVFILFCLMILAIGISPSIIYMVW